MLEMNVSNVVLKRSKMAVDEEDEEDDDDDDGDGGDDDDDGGDVDDGGISFIVAHAIICLLSGSHEAWKNRFSTVPNKEPVL